jgi:hypothetical protein
MRNRWPAVRNAAALAGSLMLASTLTGITEPAPADATAAACRTWNDAMQPVPVGAKSSLSSVAVPSASQAWAVGAAIDARGAAHALIEHWDGSAWAVVPVPRLRASFLSSVRSASPASIWAVGTVFNVRHRKRTLILHWNGRVWAPQPSPSPGSSFDLLRGVRVVSATNAWAVGSASRIGASVAGTTFILHWNGHTWARVASPNPGTFNVLAAAGATSATNAWAIGNTQGTVTAQTLILHWNGKTWRPVASPDPEGSDFLTGVTATSASNAWAVGDSQNAGSFILQWDGQSWQPVANLLANTHLNAVAASSAGNAWAVGNFLAVDGTTRPSALHCT